MLSPIYSPLTPDQPPQRPLCSVIYHPINTYLTSTPWKQRITFWNKTYVDYVEHQTTPSALNSDGHSREPIVTKLFKLEAELLCRQPEGRPQSHPRDEIARKG